MTTLVLLWLLDVLKKLGGKTPPGGTGPAPGTTPPPFPAPAPVPPPTGPVPPFVSTYVLRSGDTPSGLAKVRTGDGNRWRELLTVNPEMRIVQTREPPLEKGGPPGKVIATHVRPFNAGQTIKLPSGW